MKLRSLWEAIRQTREQLSRWQQQSRVVDALFREHIVPREKRLTEIHGELTDRLMDLHEQDSLPGASQALITLWIRENLQSLADHPFFNQARLLSLQRRWHELQSNEQSVQENRHSTQAASTLDDLFEQELDEDDIVFDFGWHRSRDAASKQADQTPAEERFRRPARSAAEDAADTPAKEDNADTEAASGGANTRETADEAVAEHTDQQLTAERLFRLLARALHPDREQDEEKKVQKHELMSACLRARQEEDIDALLTLYGEHIGELPVDLGGKDHAGLIQALQQQLQQLQLALRQQRFGNPLQRQIMERYSAADDLAIRQGIEQHGREIDRAIEQQQSSLANVTSTEGLALELSIRREHEQDRMAINSLTGFSSSL